MAVYLEDFGSPHRRVVIPKTNASAMLCSCYDIFGCKPEKKNAARKLFQSGRVLAADLQDAREKTMGEWRALVQKSTVALAAVHYFARKGPRSGTAYFARLGVKGAAENVHGRFALAAAHFERLPSSAEKSTFASYDGDPLNPTKSFYLDLNGHARQAGPRRDDDLALVRLFQLGV
jgi:hypothetical protein